MRKRTLAELQRTLADQRGRRVVFVSHCILNQNVRYLGGAGRRGGVEEVVNHLLAEGLGIHQMPCPEQRAWGGVAKRHLIPAYGSQGTMRYRLRRPLTTLFLWRTRRVYARLARQVASEITDYDRSGVEVSGVVGVGPSPSCGVVRTLDVRRSLEVIAACPLAEASTEWLNAELMSSAMVAGQGMFTRALRSEIRRRGLDVPFREHDLIAELRGRPGPGPVCGSPPEVDR